MKINFLSISDELKKPTEEIILQLGIESSLDGIPLVAEKGEGLSAVCDGRSIKITYQSLNQYFRALLIVARNGEKTYEVKEKPFASELALMIDCSRNAVGKVDHIKRLIRYIALMGYNQLQIYTEDTFEVSNEPYFGYMRGKYSFNEMKEIDDYAFSYGIEVVPCIQTLAHLDRIFKWPEYKKINDTDNILLVDDERTEILIDNIFNSLSKVYRSRKIHIGMDEAYMLGRGRYYDIHSGNQEKNEIFIKHLSRVVKIAEKYGYKPMMWSDMFFRMSFDGCYFVEQDKISIPQKIADMVPENVRLVYWDYAHTQKQHYMKMLDAHDIFNQDIIFAGGAWTWKGFAPMNKFSLSCVKPALDACIEKGIDKIMLTTWGDNGAECSVFGVLPTLCYTAERIYGHETCEETFKTLAGIDFDDYLSLDLANEIYGQGNYEYVNPCRYGLYADAIGSWMDFLLVKGSDEKYAAYAKRLKKIETKAGEFAYLFKTQRALCKALELKSDLGLRVREAYENGNKAELNNLLHKRFYPAIKRIKKFYIAFKYQWNKENKSIGFEVQDYRIGGLIKRLECDAEIISDYVKGKIKKIEQLEEGLLKPISDVARAGDIFSFIDYVTCCNF